MEKERERWGEREREIERESMHTYTKKISLPSVYLSALIFAIAMNSFIHI